MVLPILPRILCLVRPDYRQQVVLLQELTAGRVTEEVGAPAHRVVREELVGLLVAKVLQRIGPEQVAHGPVGRWFPEAIQLRKSAQMHYIVNISALLYYRLDVVECENLGRQTAVNTEELLVEEGGEGQAVERFHAGVVNTFRILDDAFNREKLMN